MSPGHHTAGLEWWALRPVSTFLLLVSLNTASFVHVLLLLLPLLPFDLACSCLPLVPRSLSLWDRLAQKEKLRFLLMGRWYRAVLELWPSPHLSSLAHSTCSQQMPTAVGDSVIIQRHSSQEARCSRVSPQGQGTSAEDAVAMEVVKSLYSVLEWSWPHRAKAGIDQGQTFSPWAAQGQPGKAGRCQVPAAAGRTR